MPTLNIHHRAGVCAMIATVLIISGQLGWRLPYGGYATVVAIVAALWFSLRGVANPATRRAKGSGISVLILVIVAIAAISSFVLLVMMARAHDAGTLAR